MNNKLYLLFNHTLTPYQVRDAEIYWDITEFVVLPAALQALWSNIPPDKDLNLVMHLKPIVDYFKKMKYMGYVLVQGDFGGVFYLVNQLQSMGYTPLYATTKRKVVEEKLPDNTIVSKRIFKHVCFRKYV